MKKEPIRLRCSVEASLTLVWLFLENGEFVGKGEYLYLLEIGIQLPVLCLLPLHLGSFLFLRVDLPSYDVIAVPELEDVVLYYFGSAVMLGAALVGGLLDKLVDVFFIGRLNSDLPFLLQLVVRLVGQLLF